MASATYDYVICGGGTAGCVVAARLAEELGVTVCVVEAGPDSKDMENVHMAGGWSRNLDSDTDWNIVCEPCPGANGRTVKNSRGRLLGGCSGVNGTACIRGPKQDYDDWGMEGWTGEDMYKSMAKAETFHPKDWYAAAMDHHGNSGPLHTEPYKLAPISELLLRSYQSEGLPYHEDMFTTGDVPHGCGNATRTVHQGIRSTGADYLLKGPKRENITIKTECTVDRVILEDVDGQLVATRVEFFNGDGEKTSVRASKEIIISAGAYCSPAILLRSGIGPKGEIEKHGIQSRVHLPGVGRNLMDHAIVFAFYETEKPGLTTDHLVYYQGALENSYQLWKEKKTGFLSAFPFGGMAYARVDERLADSPLWQNAPRPGPGRDPMGLLPSQPNIEFFSTECYGGPKQYADFPADLQCAFSIVSELFAPRSRGSVTLKSKDPKQNPIVDHNYLGDELDLLVLSEACRWANEIVMKGEGTKDVVKGAWPKGLTHHAYTSREDWVPYVKDHVTTCYHAGGTCKMGRDDDPLAVLDARLRVRGVARLRVADCSVMPLLNQGHTQMPAYGIGEKAADLINEDAKHTPHLTSDSAVTSS